jgi:flagellar biosynthetic protein FliQ
MTESYILTLAQEALTLTLLMAGPALGVSLLVGSVISLLQAATQVNEATLTFVPKVIGVGLVIFLLGAWMAQQMLTFTSALFRALPELAR